MELGRETFIIFMFNSIRCVNMTAIDLTFINSKKMCSIPGSMPHIITSENASFQIGLTVSSIFLSTLDE